MGDVYSFLYGSGVCFFQAEDGIQVVAVTGVQTCALPICVESTPGRWRLDFVAKERADDQVWAAVFDGRREKIGRASCRERV